MWYKSLTSGLLALLIILSICFSYALATSDERRVIVRTEDELIAAIDNKIEYIYIDGYIPLSETIVLNHAANVTLRGQGTITVSGNYRHFARWRGYQLVIDGDIILTRAANYDGLGGGVRVAVGTLVLHQGHIYNNHMRRGGGIELESGRVYIMDGGTVSHNHAEIGGGVYVGDTWGLFTGSLTMLTVSGGQIVENVANFSGGGVHNATGILQLESGVIANNHASGHGGVYVSDFTRYDIGHAMRIYENYPINRFESTGFPWQEFLHTLSVFHILVLLAIIVIGMLLTKIRNSQKRQRDTSYT